MCRWGHTIQWRGRELVLALSSLPNKIEDLIRLNETKIIEIAKGYRFAHHCLFLGRGYNYPVALEGALKMKEISYIHAEGYPAAEMKHGPIALIDHLMPVVFVAMKDSIYDKVKSNIQEVRARKGTVIAITDEVQCLVCLSRPPMITSRKQIRNR